MPMVIFRADASPEGDGGHIMGCIRPGFGPAPKHLGNMLGRRASRAIERGTPLDWSLVMTEDACHGQTSGGTVPPSKSHSAPPLHQRRRMP